VRFRRSAGVQPLPLPVRGGSIEALAPFVNLASDNDFVLVVAWLLGAVRGPGRYLVLAIAGEQGSAKTVLSKLLRALIDPSVALRCRAMSGNCSLRPATATSWPSTTSAAYRPGYQIPSAGSRAAVPSRPVRCSPVRTKICLRPPHPAF